eukprot:109414-Prymnesium_polylepis.1
MVRWGWHGALLHKKRGSRLGCGLHAGHCLRLRLLGLASLEELSTRLKIVAAELMLRLDLQEHVLRASEHRVKLGSSEA